MFGPNLAGCLKKVWAHLLCAALRRKALVVNMVVFFFFGALWTETDERKK
jgi:hypothetical protein